MIGIVFTVTLMFVATTSSSPVTVNQFESSSGLYFENLGPVSIISGEWKFLVYVNMTDLWNKYRQLVNLTQQTEKLCEVIADSGDLTCRIVTTQFRHQLQEITELNEAFFDLPKIRSKRSPFDFVGSLAHSLFGVLDHEYAEKMEETIQNVQSDQDQLVKLMKEQTSIVEGVVGQMKSFDISFRKQLRDTEEHLHALTQAISLMASHLAFEDMKADFNMVTMLLSILFNSFHKQQDSLIDLLTDLHHGKLNPTFFAPSRLTKELLNIAQFVPKEWMTPPPKDIPNLYKALHFAAGLTNSCVIIEIKVPLYKRQEFTLFKLHPLPIIKNNAIYILQSAIKYLISNSFRNQIQLTDSNELKQCLKMRDGKLCRNNRPFLGKNSPEFKCEFQLFSHETPSPDTCQFRANTNPEVWIQLQHANNWIFGILYEVTLEISCTDFNGISRLTGVGILQLQQSCLVKHPNMVIESSPIYESRLNASFSPLINVTYLFSKPLPNEIEVLKNHLSSLNTTVENNNDNFDNITKGLSNLNKLYYEQDHYSRTHQVHHIHHYIVIYVIAGATVFVIIILCLRRPKKRQNDVPVVWNLNSRNLESP